MVATFVKAIKTTTDPSALGALGQGLASLAEMIEPPVGDEGRSRLITLLVGALRNPLVVAETEDTVLTAFERIAGKGAAFKGRVWGAVLWLEGEQAEGRLNHIDVSAPYVPPSNEN